MNLNLKKWLFFLAAVSCLSAQEIQLTRQPFDHFFPKFSPDGHWVLYERVVESSDTLIYKIPSGGGDEILLSADYNATILRLSIVISWRRMTRMLNTGL